MATLELQRIPAHWDPAPSLPPSLDPASPSIPPSLDQSILLDPNPLLKIDHTNSISLSTTSLEPISINNSSSITNNNNNNNNNNAFFSRLPPAIDTFLLPHQIDADVPPRTPLPPPPSATPLSPTPAPAPSFTPAPSPQVLDGRYLLVAAPDAHTFEGVDMATEQRVVVKRVCPRTGAEVCAQHALLSHSAHVLAPLECVRADPHSWLVCAPHYGDLHSYVRQHRRVQQDEAVRLFRHAARAVRDCHAAGCVLRDLKLRKFVFADPARQTLCLESLEDSVVTGDSDLLTEKHGCPAYVAPEILHATAYSGRRADMWSLGVMLYTMLIGRYPFTGTPNDTSKLFANIRAGRFEVPEWVSSRARHLICLLMQRDPALRPSADEVLSHPWLVRSPRDLPLRDPCDHWVPSPSPKGPRAYLMP